MDTTSDREDSRHPLRRLARNWWRILLLWLLVSSPLVYVVYRLVEPTYQAFSLLRIESNQPDLFGRTLLTRDEAGETPSYLQTQLTVITTDPVLDQAISESRISRLPMIQDSADPKADLRKKLEIEIIPNTHWIRVALESTDPKEAAQVVNAVVDAFIENTKSFGTGATKLLKKDLEAYKDKLKIHIEKEKETLRDLAKKGNVAEPVDAGEAASPRTGADQASKLPFNSLTLDQYRSTQDQLLQTESQLVELEARLQAKQEEVQQAQARVAEADSSPASHEGLTARLKEQIAEEFKHNPEVVSLIDQIRSTTEALDRGKRYPEAHEPARVAAERRLAKLNKEYNDLWISKSEQIRQHLLIPTSATGVPQDEPLLELKMKIEGLKIKKAKLIDLVSKYEPDRQTPQLAAVEATFARDELTRLQNMYDQVDRKLEQLSFTRDKAMISIEETNPVQVPKLAYNNKRLSYMLILPVVVLLAVNGGFLLVKPRAKWDAEVEAFASRARRPRPRRRRMPRPGRPRIRRGRTGPDARASGSP